MPVLPPSTDPPYFKLYLSHKHERQRGTSTCAVSIKLTMRGQQKTMVSVAHATFDEETLGRSFIKSLVSKSGISDKVY